MRFADAQSARLSLLQHFAVQYKSLVFIIIIKMNIEMIFLCADPSSPYTCTGNFSTDFRELCRRLQLAVIPPVLMRPFPRPEVPIAPIVEEKVKPGKSGKVSTAVAPVPDPEPTQALTEPAGTLNLLVL